jgi:glycolate oxidase iron-sulfur subunit
MQTRLHESLSEQPVAREAAGLIKKCVHCGFCNATCPTYQLLGDELDGPRGRIYLIKQLLESGSAGRSTQQHLDRCLTCLNCESSCPSGVEYGRLIEAGRRLVEKQVPRPLLERLKRRLLRALSKPRWVQTVVGLGRLFRPILPRSLREKIPPQSVPRGLPAERQGRRVLLLRGCVQPTLLPNIDRSTVRLLNECGLTVLDVARTACCGALRTHLGDHEGGLEEMRHNLDVWDPFLQGEVTAIISSASACALCLKQYGRALAHDARYAARAARVSDLACDLSDLLPQLLPSLKSRIDARRAGRVVFHPPCTLQHGQKRAGVVENGLRSLGLQVEVASREAHLCCGSAGTYSLLQPQLSGQLRDRKLSALTECAPRAILSANVGCIAHLATGTGIPVKHWIEWLDELVPELPPQ